jgi:flagellar motor switch protein FliG
MALSKTDIRSCSGLDKAAMIMLSLAEEHASKLFSMMEDDEIKDLSQRMSTLGTLTNEVVEKLFVEFVQQISSTGSLVGNYDSVERLLTSTLGKERVDAIMEDIRGPAGRTMWDKLGNVNEVVLANYLKNEYPQTVAVVMSKIKSDHAARVLASLPDEFAMEVVTRMLRMEPVQKDILDDVEKTLRTEFMSNLARTNKHDSHELMAEIFNHLDRTAEARFLDALSKRNAESSERIRALMFTFEDLIKLDPGGVQTLLRSIDKSRLAIALKGASEAIRNLFFSNMSERASKILREDMQALGPVRLRDVDDAQMEVVTLAKNLADKGEIMIVDQKNEDELVY